MANLDINALTDIKFCVLLDDAIDRQIAARTKWQREDAVNEVMSLINLRANGDHKVVKKWTIHYNGRIEEAYG